ncbi:DUF4352 domain-containing protein [Pseudonocardia sp. GCM10023141]|uniref:DUF4352 domain-containing protein n=1 Tax=Pseudonocardia sp. GCM10023141 TaxID=3252653 RepID=UPI0036113382
MTSRHHSGSGRASLAAIVAVSALATACTAAPATPAPPPAAVYELPPRPVRPDEIALKPVATNEGDTVFELIGLTTGLKTLLGSHAEWPAKGQFLRIRLVVTNNGRTNVPFDTNRQLLLTADGAQHAPDSQGMLIKRQPGQIEIGANDRLEFDLYYDVPVDAKATALRVFGGPTLADFSDTTGVDIPVDAGR